MTNISTLTAVLGWCTVIHGVLLVVATISLAMFRRPIKRLHHKMMGVPEDALDVIYFKYLAYYKVAILVFNLVPYLSFRIAG